MTKKCVYCSALLLSSLILFLTVHGERINFKCGVGDKSPDAIQKQNNQRESILFHKNRNVLRDLEVISTPLATTTVINTYVHIITATDGNGTVSDEQIRNQIDVLNGAFSPYWTFILAETDVTTNDDWFYMSTWAGFISDNEKEAKSALRKGTGRDLNIYSASLPYGMLGWASFPSDYSVPVDGLYGTLDGIVITYASFPDGELELYNEGDNAVHEVGHWLGLYHTFQGGCAGGDSVDDTPATSGPDYTCPTSGVDSCPLDGQGPDMYWNYMNYVEDFCKSAFTPGQFARMIDEWEAYREDSQCFVNCEAPTGMNAIWLFENVSLASGEYVCLDPVVTGGDMYAFDIELEFFSTEEEFYAGDFFFAVFDSTTQEGILVGGYDNFAPDIAVNVTVYPWPYSFQNNENMVYRGTSFTIPFTAEGSNAVCIGNGYITEANGTAVYSGSVTVSNVASSTVHPTAAPAHHHKSNHHNDSRPLLSTKELILIVSIGGVLLLLVVGLAVRICLTPTTATTSNIGHSPSDDSIAASNYISKIMQPQYETVHPGVPVILQEEVPPNEVELAVTSNLETPTNI